MITYLTTAVRATAMLTLMALSLGAAPARAQDNASAWQDALNARARLVAGSSQNGQLLVGVDIELAANWKTYWRNPGDAGIPPLFDFSASDNLASAEVAFPVPHRLPDPGGESIGYKNRVIFPVTIRAIEADKPVAVALTLNYAVCEVLCIPVEQELTLLLPVQASATPAELVTSLAAVPGDASSASLPRIAGVKRVGAGSRERLAVDVLQAQNARDIDLFAEGPQDWYMPLPKETRRTPTAEGLLVTYEIDLAGLPKLATITDTAVTFTMAAGGKGSEQTVTLP